MLLNPGHVALRGERVRLRLAVLSVLAGLALLLAAIPSLRAQNETRLVREPLSRDRVIRSPASDETPLRRPQPRTVLRYDEQRGWYPVVVPGSAPRRPAPVESLASARPDATHVIAVLGDSLADLLAHGLEDALADRPDVAILRRTRSDSGLVRTDYHDWPKTAREVLAVNSRITLGIILLGMNDRQPIREGDTLLEPLSERWKELYRQRIDDVVAAFADKRMTLLWVGLPPMQSSRLSADLIVLNELFRQRVERGGGLYIDLWGGFVDNDNRYAASGPDLSGQVTRLRTGDGVHFTRAGARKAAHFADVAIRRLLAREDLRPDLRPAVTLPVPDASEQAAREGSSGTIERLIDAMVGGYVNASRLPDAGKPLVAIPVRPLAGPVVPLNIRPLARPGEEMLGERPDPRPRGDAAIQLDNVFLEGLPPQPKPGRADDYRWPKTDR